MFIINVLVIENGKLGVVVDNSMRFFFVDSIKSINIAWYLLEGRY